MRLLALDGVYLNATRKDDSVSHLTLLQSSRASVAIMCDTVGVYYLQTATTFNTSDPHYVIGDYQTKSTQNLLILNITGNNYIMYPPPDDLSTILRPSSVIDAALQGVSSEDTEPIDISTAQGGCCVSTAVPYTTSSSSETKGSCGAQYWLGMGSDCRPACYGKLLCAALHSVLGTEGVDSLNDRDNYTVRSFPTTRIGDCTFSSFSNYGLTSFDNTTSSTTTTITTTTTSMCLGLQPQRASDAETIKQARLLTPDATTPATYAGALQEITLWGHADFPYPLFLQNQIMQVVSFSNVNRGISNIVDSGEYVLQANQNSSFYAKSGDFKETWPALTGK